MAEISKKYFLQLHFGFAKAEMEINLDEIYCIFEGIEFENYCEFAAMFSGSEIYPTKYLNYM